MARYLLVKLPVGHSSEDIQNFEFKATFKSGGELISHNEFNYTNAEQSSIVPTETEDREIVRVPCVELSTLQVNCKYNIVVIQVQYYIKHDQAKHWQLC